MKTLRNTLRILLAFVLLFSLYSCGGGSDALPPERPAGVVDGHAVDAVISGGIVSVYAFDGGEKGKLIGSAVTDQEGYYSLDLRAPSQPILVEITGGSYVEEASSVSVSLVAGQVLRAVTHYESGQPVNVMVTPLTNLAAGLAEYKVKGGTSVENAITEASTAISTIFGLDILSTYPRNITDVSNATVMITDEYLYGFWTAAISSWTAWASEQNGTAAHSVWSSIELAQIMYNDIRSDGYLDGQGMVNNLSHSTNLGLGTVLLNVDVYRQAFAQHLLNMVNSAKNKTGLNADQLLAEANNLASSTHSVFGGASPKPLDDEGPVIIAIEPERQYHNGIFQFEVGITDFVGVESVRFDVDGAILDYATDPASPAVNIDTTTYPDGGHLIGVRAIDKLGNETYRQLSIIFDNTSPFVNITSKAVTNSATFNLTGTYTDNGVGVQSISAQGRAALLLEDGSWTVSIVLENGVNSIPVLVVDSLGNEREIEVLVALDVVKPVMNPVVYSLAKYSLNDGSFFEDNLVNADGGSTQLYFETNRLELNGVPYVTTSLSENGIPYIAFTVEDNNVNGVFTPSSDLIVRQQYTLSNNVLSSWHTIVPAENSYFGDFYVMPLVSEALHLEWDKATPDDLHLIEIQIEDKAGNIRNFTFSFKADFIVPEPVITVQDIGQTTFSGTAFADRSQLHNADIATTAYTFTNETGKSFLISLSENTTHSVTNTVDEAVREHQIRLRTNTEWRAQFADIGVVWPQPGLPMAACNLDLNWISITAIKNYDGASYVINNVPAPILGANEVIVSDLLPANPLPTSWVPFHIDSKYKGVGTYEGAVVDYIPAEDTGNLPIRAAFIENAIYCNANGNHLQRRDAYTYESLSGFPRNNYTTFAESATFNTSGLVVEDAQGHVITPVNGWYQIPAGATITVKKFITTPAMTVYDDTDVGNTATFSSYTTRKYDKIITWIVDQGLTITRAHDAGYTKAFAMTALSNDSGTGSVTYQAAR